MITVEQARELIGGDLYGADGDKVGRVGQVFLDDATGQPEWVTVSTGLFGSKETFVPIANAQVSDRGLIVPFDKDKIKGAPNVDPETGHLSQQEEAQLYSYYGMAYSEAQSESGLPASGTSGTAAGLAGTGTTGTSGTTGRRAGTGTGTAGTATGAGLGGGAAAGAGLTGDMTGGTTGRDDERRLAEERLAAARASGNQEEITLAEERLSVGTQRVESGRVRLRKFVTTEQVSTTVPVTREEVRIEREPITAGTTTAGTSLGNEEVEVVLHEERPVVQKDVVATERVRVDVDQVTENVQVSDSVRKEDVEVVQEGASGTGTTTGTTTTGTTTGTTGGTGKDDRGLLDKAKDAINRGDNR